MAPNRVFIMRFIDMAKIPDLRLTINTYVIHMSFDRNSIFTFISNFVLNCHHGISYGRHIGADFSGWFLVEYFRVKSDILDKSSRLN